MSVEAFCCEIGDLTPQQVQDVFDKCVSAGADAFDFVSGTSKIHNDYEDEYKLEDFRYFGVSDGSTWLDMYKGRFVPQGVELTYDQIDAHLGLGATETSEEKEVTSSVEWDGEGLPPVGYIGKAELWGKSGWEIMDLPQRLDYVGVSHWVVTSQGGKRDVEKVYPGGDFRFLKPETQEQREEREREEWINTACIDGKTAGWEKTKEILGNLYDAGYRKCNEVKNV